MLVHLKMISLGPSLLYFYKFLTNIYIYMILKQIGVLHEVGVELPEL